MDREGFRNRLKQYKKAREENPGLKYWEWKDIPKYDEGGEIKDPNLLRYKLNLPSVSTEDLPIIYDEKQDLENKIKQHEKVVNGFEQKKSDIVQKFNDTADLYDIPKIKDKEITLSNAGSMTGAVLSTNLLDSIYKYANITDLPLTEAIGLPAQETAFGKWRNVGGYAYYNAPNDRDTRPDLITSDWQYTKPGVLHYIDMQRLNAGYNASEKEAIELLWDDAKDADRRQLLRLRDKEAYLKGQADYLKSKQKDIDKIFENFKIIPPLQHAYEYYKTGNYNKGDSSHKQDVIRKGEEVMRSPEFKKWAKENNIKYAEGGEVGEDDFMKQFGKQVSYKPEETSWWSNVKNWWNDLTGMKNYAYGNCATTPNGKHTKECAHYSNSVLRNRGYKNIVGDAWTRAANSGMKKITSGYDGLTKPAEWDESDAHDYLQSAANNFINNVDTTALNPYDVIGLYYPDSPNTKKAFEQGRWGETQTHTGHIAVGNDGTHYVVHNVGGHLKMNKLADMLTGDYDYLPVSAYRPKK